MTSLMASKDTGFHAQDADWTRGRAQAVADAEAISRMQIGVTRKVTLARDTLAEIKGESKDGQ